MDGKQLQLVSELKILGVTFSQSLNWHNHVSNIRAKIASMAGILQRLGGDLDMKSLQSIVTSFIVPYVSYCINVWRNCAQTDMSSINRSLIRCAKLICRSHDVSLNSNTYSITGIMPFHSMVARANALCMHKLIYQNSLPYYSSVTLLMEISSRETRGTLNNKILPVKVSRTIDEHCFDVSATRFWNLLPDILTCIDNYNSFTNKLNIYVLQIFYLINFNLF